MTPRLRNPQPTIEHMSAHTVPICIVFFSPLYLFKYKMLTTLACTAYTTCERVSGTHWVLCTYICAQNHSDSRVACYDANEFIPNRFDEFESFLSRRLSMSWAHNKRQRKSHHRILWYMRKCYNSVRVLFIDVHQCEIFHEFQRIQRIQNFNVIATSLPIDICHSMIFVSRTHTHLDVLTHFPN